MERESAVLSVPTAQAPWGSSAARLRARRPWWRPRVPRTVYAYVGGDVLRITLLGAFAISLLYTAVAAYQVVRSGLYLNFVWPLLLKTLAYPLYFSLPVSLLFAVTLVGGRMVGDLEIAALKAHGFSYRQIYAPVVILGLALSAAAYWLNGWVAPRLHYARRNIQSYILDQIENLGSGVNRTILLPGDEGSLWVESYDGAELSRVQADFRAAPDSEVLPLLREHLSEAAPRAVKVLAARGSIDVLREERKILLKLRSVQILVPEPVRGSPIGSDVFHQTVSVTDAIAIPLSFAPKPPGVKDLANPDLLAHAAALRTQRRALRAGIRPADLASIEGAGLVPASFRDPNALAAVESRLRTASTEFHRRLAFAISCFSFSLLGISLALSLERFGRLAPFFAGNVIVIALYYPLLVLGAYLGERGLWPPLALALPNAALIAIAAQLTRSIVKR